MSTVSVAPTTTQTGRNKRVTKLLRDSISWYPFIIVNIVMFAIMNVIPWISMIDLSFHKWDMLTSRKFIGLANYVQLTQDHLLGFALKNSLQYVLMYVPSMVALSLFVAILVNRHVFGMDFFKSAYFLPNVTSVAVLSIVIWRFLLPRTDSPLNYLISLVGIPKQNWLVSVKLALPTIAGVNLWRSFGYYMVIWLAGLQAIPVELYHAALVDGASMWELHWYVTIPLLRPTAAFIVVTSTIGALQVFGSIFILTGGGPVHATTTVAYHIYQQAFDFGRLGYASTVSIAFFLIIFTITFLQGKYLRFGESLY